MRGDNSQQSYLLNYDSDTFGNRYQKSSRNQNNPVAQSWVEDGSFDPLTNRFTSGITYDFAGNITIDSRFRNRKFEYDANNRQRRSSKPDGSDAVVSVYDGAGQRVATKVNGALSAVFVYDASGVLAAEYGVSAAVPAGTQYVMGDHQGSTRVVMNATGANGGVVSRRDYLPFGEDVPAGVGMRATTAGYGQADGVRQKYAGMEGDEATGMSHTLWREFDSSSARWTSPDPYGGSMELASPQTFNRYTYVNNDPVNLTDPLGLMTGADQGWNSVANGFWGSGGSLDARPSIGQSIVAEAMERHDGWVKEDMTGGDYGQPDGGTTPTSDDGGIPQNPVEGVRRVEGVNLLGRAAEKSASRWVFEVDAKVRIIWLTFSFTIVPDAAPIDEISPVFSFPYTVEVRAKKTRVMDVVTPQKKSSTRRHRVKHHSIRTPALGLRRLTTLRVLPRQTTTPSVTAASRT